MGSGRAFITVSHSSAAVLIGWSRFRENKSSAQWFHNWQTRQRLCVSVCVRVSVCVCVCVYVCVWGRFAAEALHLHSVSRSARRRTCLHMHTCTEATARYLWKPWRRSWGLGSWKTKQFNLKPHKLRWKRLARPISLISGISQRREWGNTRRKVHHAISGGWTWEAFVWRVIELLASERSEIIGQLTIRESRRFISREKGGFYEFLWDCERSAMRHGFEWQ